MLQETVGALVFLQLMWRMTKNITESSPVRSEMVIIFLQLMVQLYRRLSLTVVCLLVDLFCVFPSSSCSVPGALCWKLARTRERRWRRWRWDGGLRAARARAAELQPQHGPLQPHSAQQVRRKRSLSFLGA